MQRGKWKVLLLAESLIVDGAVEDGPGSLCPLGESGALGRKASRLCSQMGRGSPSGFQWGQEHQRDRTESIAWSFLQVRAVKAELALLEVGGGGGRLHSPPG